LAANLKTSEVHYEKNSISIDILLIDLGQFCSSSAKSTNAGIAKASQYNHNRA
jgi:hypothetical protein